MQQYIINNRTLDRRSVYIMRRHKKQPEVRKQEYLDTALDLFVEKGYFKTTVQEIIDTMGASKGAFYHYFKSKEDIIHAIIELEIRKYDAVMQEIERIIKTTTPFT